MMGKPTYLDRVKSYCGISLKMEDVWASIDLSINNNDRKARSGEVLSTL
jgi:hypothetical protein